MHQPGPLLVAQADITQFIGAGQSLSNGANPGEGPYSGTFATQPYNNLMLNDTSAFIWKLGTTYAHGALMNPYSGSVGAPYYGGVLFVNNGPSGTISSSTFGPWDNTPGHTTVDGTVTWTCIGPSNVPYDITNPTASTLSLVPSVIPQRIILTSLEYPDNLQGENPSVAMINTITYLARKLGLSDYVCANSDTGSGGQAMSVINKGGSGNNYAAGIFEMQAMQSVAARTGRKVASGGILFVHGEADYNNSSYGASLLTLAQNYQTDLVALTGQTRAPIVVLSPQSSTPLSSRLLAPPVSCLQAHATAAANPAQFIDIGDKYYLSYQINGQHMHAAEYDKVGEKAGQFFIAWAQGVPIKPLAPVKFTATIGSNTCLIAFHVPFPPLQFDTSIGLNHQSSNTVWSSGFGFEAFDNSGDLTISSAAIQDNGTEVLLTFSRNVAAGLVVQYAVTCDEYGTGGIVGSCDKPGGHFGNLKDSDTFVGPFTSYAHQNWCIIFSQQGIT